MTFAAMLRGMQPSKRWKCDCKPEASTIVDQQWAISVQICATVIEGQKRTFTHGIHWRNPNWGLRGICGIRSVLEAVWTKKRTSHVRMLGPIS